MHMWPEATAPQGTVSMGDALRATGGTLSIELCFIGTEDATPDTELQNACCAAFTALT